ncbi:MAG: NAD(P)-binding domain-containing protein [Planctomycetota bacterium]|nr:NAD(P)-binding domain-containing protein [Planctomycetota bacterium]
MAKGGSAVPRLGVIGLGDWGGAVVTRLLDARFPVCFFDTNVTRAATLRGAHATAAASPAAVAVASDVILLSLPPSETFVQIAEQQLLPALTSGKSVIDLGATELAETRRLAEWLEARGVGFLDAPASGSAASARRGSLNLFVGGKKETFKACAPVLKALAGLGSITYCGPAGCGQIVKGVEQLVLGLSAAACLEALAYGGSFGLTPEALWEALERTPAARAGSEHFVKKMLSEGGEAVPVHYGELPRLLAAAAQKGQPLPLAQALVAFLKTAPPAVIENGHHVPSFWVELRRPAGKGNA